MAIPSPDMIGAPLADLGLAQMSIYSIGEYLREGLTSNGSAQKWVRQEIKGPEETGD